MNELITRKSAEEMAEAYKQALQELAEGYALLAKAEMRLHEAFGAYNQYSNFAAIDRNYHYWSAANPKDYYDSAVKQIRKASWKCILDRLQVSKVASQERREQIYKELEEGTLPELTVPAIFDMLQSFQQNMQEMFLESCKAVWEYLRPSSYWNGEYKTNSKSMDEGIGKKVILPHIVEHDYNGGFRPIYTRIDKLIEIDRVFHLLDGAPFLQDGSYNSPLVDALKNCKNGKAFETKYFRAKCYSNGNLHLEFRRMDLVHELNSLCSGNTSLRSGAFRKAAQQTSFV